VHKLGAFGAYEYGGAYTGAFACQILQNGGAEKAIHINPSRLILFRKYDVGYCEILKIMLIFGCFI